MRSRKRLLSLTSFLVAALVVQIAEAAPPAPPPTGKQSSSQFTLRREEAGGADASVARQRARAGDCAGALPAFDAAIRITIEPTLRRDRGLCHEKLGDPFPAVDDYRAYLTARPDAPDADQIRDRLSRLEESVGIGGPSAQSVRGDDDVNAVPGGASYNANSEGVAGSGSASSSKKGRASASLGPRSGEEGKSYDYYASQEKAADQAETSPLRFGTGFVIGPFLQLPRYFFSKGKTSDPGVAVGGTFRYSWAPALTFVSELGYVTFGTSGDASKLGGPLVFVGVEYRIPLNTYASDALFLGLGPGFERYTYSQSKLGLNVLNVRGRFGYRHVFGPSVGLELGVDGGPGVAFTSGVPSGGKSDSSSLGLITGAVSFVIGF